MTNGLYACIDRLVPSQEVKQKILLELPVYKAASGVLGNNFAISQRKMIAPDKKLRSLLILLNFKFKLLLTS